MKRRSVLAMLASFPFALLGLPKQSQVKTIGIDPAERGMSSSTVVAIYAEDSPRANGLMVMKRGRYNA